MSLCKKMAAELFGTFWLVFGGCGAAVLAGSFIGNAGVALAFGLTVLTMAYGVGHISGGHFNPAVSFGLLVAGRFSAKDFLPYVVAQVIGGILAALVLYVIASGMPTFSLEDGFACNGYGVHSPAQYNMMSCIVGELVLSFFFVMVIIGVTDARAPKGFAPIAIGLALALVHLIGIPLTNLSVNPARSLGPALVHGGWALQQQWMFWAVPLAGALLAGLIYRLVFEEKK